MSIVGTAQRVGAHRESHVCKYMNKVSSLFLGLVKYLLFKTYFMCRSVLPARMSGHRVHAWCLKGSNEGVRSP